MIVVTQNGIVTRAVVCRDGDHADDLFIDTLNELIPNFYDEYDNNDISQCIENGFEEFGDNMVINVVHPDYSLVSQSDLFDPCIE